MSNNRRALVSLLAPPSPPCFADRLSWLEFLISADAEARGSCLGPLDMRRTEPRFNLFYDYCVDCLAKHALVMQAQGRCNPRHLLDLIREASDVAAS